MEVFVILKKNKAEIASLTTLAFEFKHSQKKKKKNKTQLSFLQNLKRLPEEYDVNTARLLDYFFQTPG